MLIDTSGFLCLFDVSEPRYEEAKVFSMFQISPKICLHFLSGRMRAGNLHGWKRALTIFHPSIPPLIKSFLKHVNLNGGQQSIRPNREVS